MFSIWKTVPAIGAYALLFGTAASAADLGPSSPQPPLLDSAPVLVDEFSSGWYLRGDIGYRFNNDADVVNRLPPPVLSPSYENSWVVGAGVGYKWEWFRTDLTLDYGTQSDFTGDSGVGGLSKNDFKANIDTVTGLVNVYGDLGTWYGFTPYIGLGAGFAHLQTAGFTRGTGGGVEVDSTGAWNFAWAYMAGVSYQFMNNYHIDVGYRHVNMGDVETARLNRADQLTFKNVSSDEIRVGFRYVLD
jgi:opacity protein-like surface antigen